MNALRPQFPQALNLLRLATVAGTLSLGGCVSAAFDRAAVDPASPIADEVARLTGGEAVFPSFSGIPGAPTDVRPVAQYGQEAQQMAALGAQLIADTAPETWTLQDTDSFAGAAKTEVGPELPPPAPGDIEAIARELRERATPPPPR